MMPAVMNYTEEQQSVLDSVSEFLAGDDRVFILAGYAGTGKSTLILPMCRMASDMGLDVHLMAPTGRAAKVMESKTMRNAVTIHRAIYKLGHIESFDQDEAKEEELEDLELKFYYPLDLPENDTMMLCIVDEASMVSSRFSRHELFRFGSGVLLNDLLDFALHFQSGKIIFIGDPAQLPPVGDSRSCALDADFFNERHIPCRTGLLRQVVRQDSGSAILQNAIKIRKLLGSPVRNTFSMERRAGQFEDISTGDVVASYCRHFDDDRNSVATVTYSNALAQNYNVFIRRALYGPGVPVLMAGDRVIVIQNNYTYPERDIMNGDLAEVIELSGTSERRNITVWVKDGNGKRQEAVSLAFRDVTLLFQDGITLKCKVMESLLESDEPHLTINQVKALYIDFCIRHPHLKPRTREFAEALFTDPYYNALKIKYGYAVTCHKAQGGEWDYVFVDFDMRGGLHDENLRWDYTAVTRARKCLYAVNLPEVNHFSKLEILAPSRVNAIDDGRMDEPVPEDFIAVRKSQAENALKNTQYMLEKTVSKPYREIYYVKSGLDVFRFDATYKSDRRFSPFRFVSAVPDSAKTKRDTVADIGNILNAAPAAMTSSHGQACCAFSYCPSDNVAKALYELVAEVAGETGASIVNVVEHLESYYIAYYFDSGGQRWYIMFYMNNKGFISSLKPFLIKGDSDACLSEFLDVFRNHVF